MLKKNQSMKVIFSRKGFDSEYGSADSPILPDSRMISIPIPVDNSELGIDYDNILVDNNKSYLQLMKELKIIPKLNQCHLDPDLRKSILRRNDGWKPLFGQSGISKRHLIKKEVSKGDIFLFFGSFKSTFYKDNQLSFQKEHARHVIFGYLIIDEIWDLGINGIDNFVINNPLFSWAFDHPHFNYKNEKDNVIFVSQKNGAGTFKYNDGLALTKLGYLKSVWELPTIFSPENVSISYHEDKNRFCMLQDKLLLQTVGKGQDFVVTPKDKKAEKQLEEWVHQLIGKSEIYE
jgi:hypothetical protein